MSDLNINPQLLELIKTKSVLSKDTTDVAFEIFMQLKELLLQMEKTLNNYIGDVDRRIKIQYVDKGTFEAELKVSDDILIFMMHSNVFVFDDKHPLMKSGYVHADNSRATCAMISIYNFLSDSFKFERKHDAGHLIARIFINHEKHFFVEGKKQLGVLFNDFGNDVLDKKTLQAITETALLYSLDIDVVVPPFDQMASITVSDVIEYSLQGALSTGKRLGFKSENRLGEIE